MPPRQLRLHTLRLSALPFFRSLLDPSYVENTEGEIGKKLGHKWKVRLPSVAYHGKFVHKLLIVKEQE